MAKIDPANLSELFTASVQDFPQTGNIVEDLLSKGYAVEEAKERLFETRVNIRESLRSLDGAGMLNADQSAQLHELYKPRERKNGDESDNAGE